MERRDASAILDNCVKVLDSFLAIAFYLLAYVASKAEVEHITGFTGRLSQYWWIILAGMSFGTLAGIAYKLAYKAIKHSKDALRTRRFWCTLACGVGIDATLIGGAVFALYEIYLDIDLLSQMGMSIKDLGPGCWLTLGIINGVLVGHGFVKFVMSRGTED